MNEKGDIDMDEVDADLIKNLRGNNFNRNSDGQLPLLQRPPLCPLPNYTGRFYDEYSDEWDACSDLSVDNKLLHIISKVEYYKTIHQIPPLVYQTWLLEILNNHPVSLEIQKRAFQ